MEHPEIEVFPESDTFGLLGGGAPGANVEFAKYFEGDTAVDFWGEEDGTTDDE